MFLECEFLVEDGDLLFLFIDEALCDSSIFLALKELGEDVKVFLL